MTIKEFIVTIVFNSLVVFILARSEELGLQAVQQLQQLNPDASKKVKFHPLDITSVESIHHLSEHIKRTHGGLDILINNAAIAFKVMKNKTFLIKIFNY